MVEARLWKRARAHGYGSTEAYFDAVQQDVKGEMVADLIDSLTTNFTSFFREPAHFEFFRRVILPGLKKRAGSFQIWCAASATGEEPYSIAITMAEEFGPGIWGRGQVLATDISHRALRVADSGIYAKDRFRDFDEMYLRRHFLRGRGEQEGNYCVRKEIRQLVRFEQLNLMEPLPAIGPFPMIWLRNIMIYFDRPTQQRLVQALSAKLEPGGYLFVGHSESLNGIEHGLEHVQVAIYRKPAGNSQRSSHAAAQFLVRE